MYGDRKQVSDCLQLIVEVEMGTRDWLLGVMEMLQNWTMEMAAPLHNLLNVIELDTHSVVLTGN